MPEQPKPGSIVHVEFHSRNPSKTKQFYAEVFGWKFQDRPEMDYIMFEAPSGPGGGVTKPMGGMQPGVLNYILSDSIEKTAKKIEQAGGSIIMAKSEIPNFGWFAIFSDPEGTVNAIYQAKEQPRARQARRSTAKAGSSKTTRRRRK